MKRENAIRDPGLENVLATLIIKYNTDPHPPFYSNNYTGIHCDGNIEDNVRCEHSVILEALRPELTGLTVPRLQKCDILLGEMLQDVTQYRSKNSKRGFHGITRSWQISFNFFHVFRIQLNYS